MYFLFSGEGPTDLGQCDLGLVECEGTNFKYGPLAVIVEQIANSRRDVTFLGTPACSYLSESALSKWASKLKSLKKSPRLPGKKRAKETTYFYQNARALARCARDKERRLGNTIVAILFRDSDGTASAGRGDWAQKQVSMLKGFEAEGFTRGVPMIPKPISEAWLLCAKKDDPYENCKGLEERSGSPKAPNSLKEELERRLGTHPSREAPLRLGV